MLKISEINCPDELHNEQLRARAEKAGGGWVDQYLIARIESAEAALLVLDHYPKTETACIHEIFVLAPYRRLGIGTKMLKHAETRARALGCRAIQLEVYPLDDSIDKVRLRAWYTRHGYEREEDSPDKLRKVLASLQL